MKKNIFYTFLLLPFLMEAQAPKTTRGEVEAVTVFLKGATVTESASVLLKKGYNSIAIEHLPSDIDPARISVQFNEQIDVLSVTAGSEDEGSILKKNNIVPLDDSISLIKKLKQGISFRTDALNLELELLKRNLYIGGTNTGVSILELQKASDFYKLKQEDIYGRLLKEKALTDVLDKLNANLQYRKDLAVWEYKNLNGTVSVQVDSKMAGLISFKLKYFTLRAAWKPIYDIKVEDVGKPMVLTQKGKILNQTEKDWKDIDLVLSTADPSISINRPVLDVWALEYGYVGKKIINPKYMDENKAFRGYDKEPVNLSNTAYQYGDATAPKPGETTITVSELSNDFAIPEKANILSGKFPQTIVIKSYTLNCTYEYTGIPKLEAIPYLIGKTIEWRNIPLSDGPASIYIGNNFIGESYIDVANISDTMEISLGRNKKVVVDKKMKQDFTRKSFLGGNITENFIYEISIKNNNSNEIIFELWDQVPVSKQEDIIVTVSELSGAVKDDKTGKLTWRFNLKPGEERKITFSFSVRYPRGKNVQINRFKALRCPDF